MDHRILENQLRRGCLVEAILGVGTVLDILDPQHGVGIPELSGLERFTKNIDQRALVRMVEWVAIPVRQSPVEPDFAVSAELQYLLEPGVIGIAGAVHVAPSGRAHVPALAGEPGPAALG